MAKNVFSHIPIDPNFNEMSQDSNIFVPFLLCWRKILQSSKKIYLKWKDIKKWMNTAYTCCIPTDLCTDITKLFARICPFHYSETTLYSACFY